MNWKNWEDLVTEPDRLDRWLHQRLPEFSMARVRELIESGRVRVNGFTAKKGAHLKAEDIVTVRDLEPGPLPLADEVEIDIVYGDDRVLVVDKPAGMPTQPLSPEERGTLVNAVLAREPGLRGVGDKPLEPGLVHRLDAGTSGLVLFAKDGAALIFFRHELEMRRMDKTYRALVRGEPKPARGEIKIALAHHPSEPGLMVPAVNDADFRGEPFPALTRYRTVATEGGVSLVELDLVTGVTHQLRVHLAHLGFPVLGDDRYGDRPNSDSRKFALQAARLVFAHPDGHQRIIARVSRELALEDRNRF
jgi:23S rRNA pseudouridine1911/1915/1917 synthase